MDSNPSSQTAKLYQNVTNKISERTTNPQQTINPSPSQTQNLGVTSYKSKFTLMNKPVELGLGSEKNRNKKSFQFTTQPLPPNQDSYRKNTNITNQQKAQSGLFSPKISTINASVNKTQKNQIPISNRNKQSTDKLQDSMNNKSL